MDSHTSLVRCARTGDPLSIGAAPAPRPVPRTGAGGATQPPRVWQIGRMELSPHHAESIRNLVRALERDRGVEALILGGSLAHGFARPDSDIDVSIVVGSPEYQQRVRENRLTYYDESVCTYPDGYVDGKFVDVDFLRQVAASGSDPARYAYQDARILFSRVPDLAEVLAAITRYPVAEKPERIERFAAQLLAWRWFYGESRSKQSRYLEVLALQKLVLFTCRIVLAANELLYPFHKWMLRVTETATNRPPKLIADLEELLANPSVPLVDAHVRAVLAFYGVDYATADAAWSTWFMKDTELAWTSGFPPVDDL